MQYWIKSTLLFSLNFIVSNFSGMQALISNK